MRGSLIPLNKLTPRMGMSIVAAYGRGPFTVTHVSGLSHVTVGGFLDWFEKEVGKMPNLFPDQSRGSYDGSEDFIFGAPIDVATWTRLQDKASFCMNASKTPYVSLPKEVYNDDCEVTLLLRREEETDDDMLEAAAWLRMAKDCRARIYAVGSYSKPPTLFEQLTRTNGLSNAHRKLSIMFDIPKEAKK